MPLSNVAADLFPPTEASKRHEGAGPDENDDTAVVACPNHSRVSNSRSINRVRGSSEETSRCSS